MTQTAVAQRELQQAVETNATNVLTSRTEDYAREMQHA
jgi:hypothetical protein